MAVLKPPRTPPLRQWAATCQTSHSTFYRCRAPLESPGYWRRWASNRIVSEISERHIQAHRLLSLIKPNASKSANGSMPPRALWWSSTFQLCMYEGLVALLLEDSLLAWRETWPKTLIGCAELKQGNGKYLEGDHVTAADTMIASSIHSIFQMDLAPKNKRWEGIEAYLTNVEGQEWYRRPVARTGHQS